MGVLFNFGELDEKATIQKVGKFFKTDVVRLERMANSSLNSALRSPNLDKIGGHANGNHVEDMMMNSLNAKQELRLIVDTIQLCDLDNKTILTEECIHHKSPLKVMMDDLLCSKSNYYKKRQDALLEFADRYANKGRDLHIYKKSAELAFCNGLTPKKS